MDISLFDRIDALSKAGFQYAVQYHQGLIKKPDYKLLQTDMDVMSFNVGIANANEQKGYCVPKV